MEKSNAQIFKELVEYALSTGSEEQFGHLIAALKLACKANIQVLDMKKKDPDYDYTIVYGYNIKKTLKSNNDKN